MNNAFEVVAEPNRRRILELLCERERPVGDLVHELALSQPTVSKHLRVLRDAGVVDIRRNTATAYYRLVPEPLVEIDDWLTPFRENGRAASTALGENPPRRDGGPMTERSWERSPREGDGYVVRFERHLAPSPGEGVAGVDRVGAPRGTGCRATSWASAGLVPRSSCRSGRSTSSATASRRRPSTAASSCGTRRRCSSGGGRPTGCAGSSTRSTAVRVLGASPRGWARTARARRTRRPATTCASPISRSCSTPARRRRWSTPTRRPWRCATRPRYAAT